jgi:hypothetical protein
MAHLRVAIVVLAVVNLLSPLTLPSPPKTGEWVLFEPLSAGRAVDREERHGKEK